MRCAVVTGASGFVGCNLVEVLLAHGYFVYAVVRKGSSHNERLAELNRVKLIYADMSEYNRLAEMMDATADVFFHIAWAGGRYDFDAQWKNIDATLDALRAAKKMGCERFVATGSQAEYGPQTDLITEETLPQPIDAYGSAKLATCVLSRQLALDIGIDWIWGRIFSVYGKYEPPGRMLPDLIEALLAGKDYTLSAATQYWDYLHSTDCAEALVALAERGKSGEIYNIANGRYRPLKEFTEEIRAAVSPEAVLKYGPEVQNKYSLTVETDKIRRHTGWMPRVVFDKGIEMVIDNAKGNCGMK